MSNQSSEKSMMLLTSNWAKEKSFNLIPISNECPYVEALYNPSAETLAVIGKTKKDTFHMIPRLDDNGHPQQLKISNNTNDPYKKQRVQQESYTEYYITDKEEIKAFIKFFAVNESEFNYLKHLDAKPSSNLVTSPELIK